VLHRPNGSAVRAGPEAADHPVWQGAADVLRSPDGRVHNVGRKNSQRDDREPETTISVDCLVTKRVGTN
jgi:hypothetical protein